MRFLLKISWFLADYLLICAGLAMGILNLAVVIPQVYLISPLFIDLFVGSLIPDVSV